MIVTLQTERIGTLDGVRAFVEGSGPVDFKLADRASAHDFVRRTLVRFGYHVRGKPAKGLLRAFLGKATGLSRAQVARLIRQHRETGKVEDRRRGPPARPFQRKYTKADVRLLAEAGCSTSCASGTSPSRAPGARTTTRLWKARTAPVAAGRGGLAASGRDLRAARRAGLRHAVEPRAHRFGRAVARPARQLRPNPGSCRLRHHLRGRSSRPRSSPRHGRRPPGRTPTLGRTRRDVMAGRQRRNENESKVVKEAVAKYPLGGAERNTMAYSIDTAAAMRRLESAGLNSEAARAIVETVAETDQGLATKADLAALKSDLTTRILAAQVATATVLFAALRYFG